MDHFYNPRNVGEIEDASGVGEVGNPSCGDIMKLYIKVENDRIKDISFETMGCVAAISTSSMITDMAKGKTLAQAMKISYNDVAGELGKLPPIKMHCADLAVKALQKAIKNYKEKNKK